MMYVLLVVGFIMLVKGADLFVDGSASIAKKLGVSSLVIGLTIVACGTSLPEASVSLTSSFTGNNEIALSNVVGSNIFNLFLILGLCAAIRPVVMDKKVVARDFPVCVAVSVILLLFSIDGVLGRIEGALLIAAFAGYILVVLKNKDTSESNGNYKDYSTVKSIVMTVVGVALVIGGGTLVVNNASEIAESFGLSQTLIGLTIVAIGTSLPELVTSLTALKKQDTGIALGNVIGSNIFNILFILGGSSLINPLETTTQTLWDMGILSAAGLVMYVACLKHKKCSRLIGICSVVFYVAYAVYICLRG